MDSPVVGCHEIHVDGRSYRYYLTPPKEGPNGEALLVDIGGPGLSLARVLPQDHATQLSKDLGPLAKGKGLLLIEEPWVGGATDVPCRDSSAHFYSWVRKNWKNPRSAEFPHMQCPWGQGQYGWSQASYRKIVAAIRAQHDIRDLDMAALSFGAVRYSYIDDMVRSATLVRPAAAPGTSNSAVIQARAEQAWKSLTSDCRGCTSSSVKDQAGRLIQHYSGAEIALASRSVPVTDFDIASALVASAMGNGPKPSLAWRSSSSKVDEAAAAKLSDALWLRVGEEAISPALVAYIDEYCQAYGGSIDRSELDTVGLILSAPVLCAGSSDPPTQRPRPRPRPVSCVIAGVGDTSAPPALAKTWRVRADGASVTSRAKQHWFTDVKQCAKGK